MSFEAKFLFAAALLSLSCVDKALSECDFNPTKACFALIEKPCGGKCLKGTKCDEETDGCVPCSSDCSGRACGGDGCGGLCGACAQGFECGADFHCVSAKEGCRTEETPGCGGCGGCIPYCDRITEPFLAFDLPYFKACGGDGCGGSCGTCGPGEYCSTTGDCVSDFINIGEPCLTDGECLSGFCVKNKYGEYFCSATCVNKCPAGFECKPDQTSPTGGLCHQSDPCYADCDGKDCGHNGCGGSCGDCGEGMVCDANGKCAAASNGCDARLLVPGCDGCGCEEEVCALMPECCAVSWDPICVTLCGSAQKDGKPCECSDCADMTDGCKTSVIPPWDETFECRECVCGAYPHCCSVMWDYLCVLECGKCGQECPFDNLNL